MRSLAGFAALLTLSLTALPLCASPPDNTPPDQQSIDALLAKASEAQPREQCFLYAEAVNQMTELSIRQYAAGDVTKATGLLERVQQLAQKIHFSLAENDKRLKNAEILLNHTVFRLNEMLHASSLEDRPMVQKTITQVTQAQSEAMMQVFQK